MNTPKNRHKVGELRPSQILFTFGIGAIVDLPRLSVMIMGLDDWDINRSAEIGEERLRAAVQAELGSQVTRLLAPPVAMENGVANPFEGGPQIGVPVQLFPRWMVCPYCHLLAPLNSGLFELKVNPYRVDQTRYVHINCRAQTPQTVLPARFLVACEQGHLDDFPWMRFVHRGDTQCRGPLRLTEQGVSGEAADIQVMCDGKGCGMNRSMADAFGEEGKKNLPPCPGRRPHLRDYDPGECKEQLKTILLGASNSWFPLILTALSIPVAPDRLGQLVDATWHILEETEGPQNIKLLRRIGQLNPFSEYSDDELWAAIERKRAGSGGSEGLQPIKLPEWQLFSQDTAASASADFRVTRVQPPGRYSNLIASVGLVERLREVRALIGFSRIESPGEFGESEEFPEERRAPLARKSPVWVPAADVRGEGLFIHFNEKAIQAWERSSRAILQRNQLFLEAHKRWRRMRHLDPDIGYPGLRYFLLHSFSHALMRQFALECGYTAASIRERIYSLPPAHPDGPMAGVLIYTAASDSEGTLGGLVSLGTPEELERHLNGALESMELCASDPLCAERVPVGEECVLHGAACHACLFAPRNIMRARQQIPRQNAPGAHRGAFRHGVLQGLGGLTMPVPSDLLDGIYLLADQLPSAAVQSLVQAIAASPPTQWAKIKLAAQGALAHPAYRELVGELVGRWRILAPDLEPEVFSAALESAAYAARASRMRQSIELTWTGPDTHVAVRRTDQALLQLIDTAQHELFIVSFAVYKIPEVKAALKRAAVRGVRLYLIVESPEESAGKITHDGLAAIGQDVAAVADVLRWPLEKRPVDGNGKHGSLHVKCAIADDRMLLISSANLTEYAFTLNMEMGVLITGGHLPRQAANQFSCMIEDRTLVQVEADEHSE